jgi:hypothetical protein
MSNSEPAIACAVAALGLMQLSRRGLPSLPVYSHVMDHARGTLALRKYVQATSRIQDLVKDVGTTGGRKGIETVLVACLVLMCFELVRGGGSQAAMHLRNGLRILHSCVGISSDGEPTKRLVRVKRDPRSSLDTLTRLFVCLDCNIVTFGANGNAYLHAIYDTPETSLASMLPSVPTSFDSLDEAAWHLSALSKAVSCARGKLLKVSEEACLTGYSETLEEVFNDSRIQVLSRWVSLSGNPELAAELRQLEFYVETWSHAISNMPMESGSSKNSSHTALRIHFFVVCLHPSPAHISSTTNPVQTWFFAAFWRDPSETMGDRHHHAFANFLELVKINLQSDSLQRPKSDLLKGAMSLLFLLACKCRNSTIRWTAVSLLHDLKLQEGAFHSEVLAMFACQIVRLEESRAREITGIEESYLLTYEDVPEQARFMDVTLDLDESQPDLGILVCARLSDDDEGGIIVEKHCFAISEVAGLPHSLATRG